MLVLSRQIHPMLIYIYIFYFKGDSNKRFYWSDDAVRFHDCLWRGVFYFSWTTLPYVSTWPYDKNQLPCNKRTHERTPMLLCMRSMLSLRCFLVTEENASGSPINHGLQIWLFSKRSVNIFFLRGASLYLGFNIWGTVPLVMDDLEIGEDGIIDWEQMFSEFPEDLEVLIGDPPLVSDSPPDVLSDSSPDSVSSWIGEIENLLMRDDNDDHWLMDY